jgi:two-component sensor histidine kinase
LTTGLIVNELVTNAFKYAFDGDRPGKICVDLEQADGGLELAVTDDGAGLMSDRQPGLGTRLVTVLAAQLGGTAEWSSHKEGGCSARVNFPRAGA